MDKRKDFGEEIPGSRKDKAKIAKQILNDLSAFAATETDVSSEQLQAKLRQIRRDDIWGTLEDRLASLQEQEAGPALALAWRVLYRSVAASAGSTELKPVHRRFGRLQPKNAYVFGTFYETALHHIAKTMEDFPLDATWSEINLLGLRTPDSVAFISGDSMIEEIKRTELIENIDTKEAINAWLTSDMPTLAPKSALKLVLKKGGWNNPLSLAKTEVFDEYLPGWKEELNKITEEVVAELPPGYDKVNHLSYFVQAALSASLVGNYPLTNNSSSILIHHKDLLDEKFGGLDLIFEDLSTRVLAAPGFDPWTTIKTKKASPKSNESEATPFESIFRPKIMPATRFENLKRETSPGAPVPRVGNVTEDELMELVPFRGIQYGNWATQAERQEMLNMAYDAMSDLSLALDVSPKYLALPVTSPTGTQSLGLALGARGRGGKAVAHYEAREHVINLTKTKGGGSLAHEWMHAYDHKVATGLSVNAQLASDVAGNQVYDFVKLLRNNSQGDDFTEAQANSRDRRKDMMLELLLPPTVEQKLSTLVGDDAWKTTFGEAFAAVLLNWAESVEPVKDYACKGRYLDRDIAGSNMEAGLIEKGVPNAAASSIADLWSTQVAGSEWLKLDRKLYRDRYTHKGQTSYLNNAEVLNGNKSIGYWTAPTELFARAGSAIVFDRLRENHGIANGFLDATSDPANFNANIHKANPNPAGVERERFKTAFTEMLLIEMQKEDANASYQLKVGSQMRMRF